MASLQALTLGICLVALFATQAFGIDESMKKPLCDPLRAKFSYGGIRATITFKEFQSVIKLVKEGASYHGKGHLKLKLHTFPVMYDVEDRCSKERLGPVLYAGTDDVKHFAICGKYSIEGRSVALYDSHGEIVSCATVERLGYYVTARATFRKGILGSVVFRQDADKGYALTRVMGDLYFDDSAVAKHDFRWKIGTDDDCSSLSAIYNPTDEKAGCDADQHKSCPIGDLTGKLGHLSIGSSKGTQRFAYSDHHLPLSGSRRVVGKKLIIFKPGDKKPRACAVITEYVRRVGVASFYQGGITGHVTMKQRSPYDPTYTQVALQNLRTIAGGYHVHNWPVPQRLAADQAVCSGASVSGHFNPFGIMYDDNTPAPGEGTEEMYEIGDLSRKYKPLNDLDSIDETYTDYNLPLFGVNSVLGRSIVIHRASDGSRWACATIQQTSSRIYALATFKYPVIGYALFQQNVEDGQDVSIYVQLDYADGSTTVTEGHGWGVYTYHANQDKLSTDANTRCNSSGSTYNPFYAENGYCSPANPLMCELGDLSGRHGPLSVGAMQGPSRMFFTDSYLSLHGLYSIIGRSVVLKGQNGNEILACANVKSLSGRKAEVYKWMSEKDYGRVIFSQYTGVIQDSTSVQLNLKSLPHYRLNYDISTSPFDPVKNEQCDGNVYNPFNAPTTSEGATIEQMAVGALSGKFGPLMPNATSREDTDPTLDLIGPFSVVGRTLRLRTKSGRTVVCGGIIDRKHPGAIEVSGIATFTGDVVGYILLKQYIYPDRTKTDTSVLFELKNADGQPTMGHNWHVHQLPVQGDGMAATGRCQSAAGHYNPFMVNVMENYDECGPSNQLRCELGDQSNKLGRINMGSSLTIGTDINLPLVGPRSVLGRSFVIHQKDGGGPRIACADILPGPDTPYYDVVIKTPGHFDRSAVAEAVAAALKTRSHNVLVYVMRGLSNYRVTTIRLYFLGLHGKSLFDLFKKAFAKNHAIIGPYYLHVDEFLPSKAEVCTLESRGRLAMFSKEKVKLDVPCNYKLAHVQCGDFEVIVLGSNAFNTKYRMYPDYIKVVVKSKMDASMVWAGKVSVSDLEKFVAEAHAGLITEMNASPWVILSGANYTHTYAWYDPLRKAAVVSDAANTFKVEFRLHSKILVAIGCPKLDDSAHFPLSLCNAPGEPTNVLKTKRRELKLKRKSQVLLLAILRNTLVPQTGYCHTFVETFTDCADAALAVKSCEAIHSYGNLVQALKGEHQKLFNVCLKAFCKKDIKSCQLLKTTIAKVVSHLPSYAKKALTKSLKCKLPYYH